MVDGVEEGFLLEAELANKRLIVAVGLDRTLIVQNKLLIAALGGLLFFP